MFFEMVSINKSTLYMHPISIGAKIKKYERKETSVAKHIIDKSSLYLHHINKGPKLKQYEGKEHTRKFTIYLNVKVNFVSYFFQTFLRFSLQRMLSVIKDFLPLFVTKTRAHICTHMDIGPT